MKKKDFNLQKYGVDIQNLAVEITRDCNLTCGHCLRGNCEKEQFNKEKFINFVINNNIRNIGTLTIAGAEPTLNMQGLKDLLEAIKTSHLEVQNVYMVTNGTNLKIELFKIFYDFCKIASDNDISNLNISNSKWHKKERENLTIKNKEKNYEKEVQYFKNLTNNGEIGFFIIEQFDDEYYQQIDKEASKIYKQQYKNIDKDNDNFTEIFDQVKEDIMLKNGLSNDFFNFYNKENIIQVENRDYPTIIEMGRGKTIKKREPFQKTRPLRKEENEIEITICEEDITLSLSEGILYYTSNFNTNEGGVVAGCDFSFQEIDKRVQSFEQLITHTLFPKKMQTKEKRKTMSN